MRLSIVGLVVVPLSFALVARRAQRLVARALVIQSQMIAHLPGVGSIALRIVDFVAKRGESTDSDLSEAAVAWIRG